MAEKQECLVTLELGMSPEEFEAVRKDFVKDFATVLRIKPSEVKIVEVRGKVESPFIKYKGGVYLTSSVATFLASATADATRRKPSKRRKP